MPDTAQNKTGATGPRRSVTLQGHVGFSWPYRIFNIVFAVLVAGLLLLAIFANPGTAMAYRWYWLLCAAALGTGFFWLLHMLVIKLPGLGGRAEIATVGVLLLLFALLQFFVGWQLRVTTSATWAYGWDFPLVYTYAEEYVVNGALPDHYFLNCENNTSLYVLFVAFFSIFHRMGLSDFTVPTLVLNILCIDTALLLLYRAARLLMGQQKALFILLCAFLTSPFLLYVPIYYTDTLTLPFVMGGVYLWLRCRRSWRHGAKGNALSRFCGLSALCAVGGLLKPTVLIVWVAACIDLLITLSGKGRWKLLLSGGGLVLALFLGGSWLVRNNGFLPAYNYDNGVPLTLWVLMGLTGQGGYNDNTFQAVLVASATKAGRSTYVANQISATIGDMGVGGVLAHLGEKLAYTFGDATYYAPIKLDQRPVAVSALHNWVIQGENGFPLYAYGSFAVHAAMLVGMLAGSIKSLLRKNDAFTFARVAVFGLVLFLLIWETRSRYLVNFLPVMLLAALEGLPRPQGNARKKKNSQGKKGKKQASRGSSPQRPAGGKQPAAGEQPAGEGQPPAGEAAAAEVQPTSAQPVAEAQPAAEKGEAAVSQDTGPAADQTPQAPALAPSNIQPTSLFGEAAPERPRAAELQGGEDGMIQPEILSAEPELVEVTHTQSFDIPTGDPFYELAHTASWKVTELRPPQPAPAKKERRRQKPEAEQPAAPAPRQEEPSVQPPPEAMPGAAAEADIAAERPAPEPAIASPEEQAGEPVPSRVNSNDLLQRAMATAFAPAPQPSAPAAPTAPAAPAAPAGEPAPRQQDADGIPVVPEDRAPITDFPTLFAELEQELAAQGREKPAANRRQAAEGQSAPPEIQNVSRETDGLNGSPSAVPTAPQNTARSPVPLPPAGQTPPDFGSGAQESPAAPHFAPSKALQGMPNAETPPAPGEPRPLKTLWDLEKDM